MSGDTQVQLMKRKTMDDIDLWLCTNPVMDKRSICWTIAEFSNLVSDSIVSPLFTAGSQCNHIWRLEVRPKNQVGPTAFLSVRARLIAFGGGYEEDKGQMLNLRFKVAILNQRDQNYKEMSGAFHIGREETCGFDQCIQSEYLDATLLHQDKLRLRCDLFVETDFEQLKGQVEAEVTRETKVKRIRRVPIIDLEELGINEGIPDVAVIGPTRAFLAHKSVLIRESPFFTMMLNPPKGQEYPPGKQPSFCSVLIGPTTTDEIVEIFLKYIYTSEIDESDLKRHIRELLVMAKEYNIPGLLRMGENLLEKCLSIENAASIFGIAHHYRSRTLQQKIVQFIRNHPEVKNTRHYEEALLQYPKLGMIGLWSTGDNVQYN